MTNNETLKREVIIPSSGKFEADVLSFLGGDEDHLITTLSQIPSTVPICVGSMVKRGFIIQSQRDMLARVITALASTHQDKPFDVTKTFPTEREEDLVFSKGTKSVLFHLELPPGERSPRLTYVELNSQQIQKPRENSIISFTQALQRRRKTT